MFECIRTRRSIRDYDPHRPVPEEALREILHAASWAPSGANAQPWHFYVVRSPAVIEKMRAAIRAACPAGTQPLATETLFNAGCLIGVCVDLRVRRYHYKPPLVVESLDDAWGNPDLFSVAAAIQNLLLAAHARGIGTCWCRLRPTCRAILERLLAVAPQHRLVANVVLGYYHRVPPEPTRKALDEICTFVG